MKTTCNYCQTEFEITPEELHNHTFNFCSDDCLQLFYGGGYNDRKELDEFNKDVTNE